MRTYINIYICNYLYIVVRDPYSHSEQKWVGRLKKVKI